MNPNTYQELVERTKSAAKDQYLERISLSGLGICGEAAELAELFSAWVFDRAEALPPRGRVVKEAGDVCWYLAHLMTTVDRPFEPVVTIARNIVAELPTRRANETVFALMTNAGMLGDYLKKVAHHHIELSPTMLHGRVCGVMESLLRVVGILDIPLEEVFETNIEKLKARYPAGFTTAESLARKDGEKLE